MRRFLTMALAVLGILGILSGLRLVHFRTEAVISKPAKAAHFAATMAPAPLVLNPPPSPPPPPSNLLPCTAGNGNRPGISLQMDDPSDGRSLGEIRLILRPEWCRSALYAQRVAESDTGSQSVHVYRLEPGFLIQGSLRSRFVPTNKDKTRAPKVMERGEVGWAGGGAGPDFFIYLGTGPASWLGNPHDGTIWAEVADEESMAVAENVSLLPMGVTPPGQMHVLRKPVAVRASPWDVPHGALDVSLSVIAPPPLSAVSLPTTHPSAVIPLRQPLGLLKVGGATLDDQSTRCPAPCHALARTELHGSVVTWGEKHLQPDAAACCAACMQQAAAANVGQRACNVWVYCSSAARCGKRHRQCWLKSAPDLWADRTLLVGTSDAWTAGTLMLPPADHPSGAGRALPNATQADLALSVVVQPSAVTVRLRLRGAAAPRAAAVLSAFADAHMAALPKGAVPSSGSSALSCEVGPARLLGAVTPTAGYGNESVADGLDASSRWPRGAALLRGTLGQPLPTQLPWTNATGPTAVEAQPVAVRRGSVAWAVPGGDGPVFFIALADMPHLGVSLTVWADVVEADLHALDALAAEATAGRVQLPASLHVGRVRPSVSVA